MSRIKTTLWGGPQDGAEARIDKDDVIHYVPGPPRLGPMISEPKITYGRYVFNTETDRFEWDGYVEGDDLSSDLGTWDTDD